MSPQLSKIRANRSRVRGIASLAVLALLTVSAGELPGQQVPDPGSSSRSTVHALARLEPQSGLVVVGARPGARILKIAVEEGDVVKAGATLATLEGNEQAQKQVDLVVAQKARALELRSRAREKAKLERAQVDAMLKLQHDSLASQVEITQKKNATAQGLYTGLSAVGGVAKLPPKDQIELEAALYLLRLQAIKSDLELKEVDARMASLKGQRELEDKELADGGAEDALLDRQVEVARAALAQTVIAAPSPGTILSVDAHAGETSSGPLLTLGDLSSIVARAEVDQSDIGKLRVGDVAKAMVLDEPIIGRVTRVGSLVGFNAMRSLDPRAAQDIRVVRVTVQLDKPELASRLIGMQVDVAIEPGSGPSPSGVALPAR